MSIAEKLTTVAENQEKVYKAGQSSMVDESKIIEKTVSGTNIVVIDDTSEIPHDVGCKVESVNMFPISGASFPQSVYGITVDYDATEQIYTINGTLTLDKDVILKCGTIELRGGATYTFSRSIISGECTNLKNMSVFLSHYGSQPHQQYLYFDRESKTFTQTDDVIYEYQTFWILKNTTFTDFKFKVQLNEGNTALPYTPYVDVSGITVKRYGKSETDNPEIYTVNPDGTVDGIKSLCPVMTLSSNVDGVKLTVDYHKSWGKQEGQQEVLRAITNNYTRTYYFGFFCQSDFSDVVFEKTVYVKNMGYLFQEYKGEYIPQGLDLTNVTETNAQWLCRWASKLKIFPDIKLPIMTKYNGSWQGCENLETIEIIRVNENTTFDVSFSGCKKLKNVAFEGVIGIDIVFDVCGDLSKASILNVFEHLSSTASGKTATFKTSAIASAFGSTSATEWTNLVTTKPNWTITLV